MPDAPAAPEHPPPFRLLGSAGGPLLLATSHSGRHYPPSLLRNSRLPHRDFRRAEDPLVDTLLYPASAHAPVLAATFARAYLDLNRHPDELDPEMFSPRLGPSEVKRSERVAAGLGVVPRIVGPGRAIYARTLPAAEATRRLDLVHRPWHAKIDAVMASAREAAGYAVLVDCHSMPSADRNAPQIVLGDRHGATAADSLVGFVERWFSGRGYRVARNVPYAGAYSVERHGHPADGLHALQIEIDRALYLDETRLVANAGFNRLAADLAALVVALLPALPSLRLLPGWRLAAE